MSSRPYLSVTFPIGARKDKPKLGLNLPGLLSDLAGRRWSNVESVLAVNLIDSYRERSGMLDPLLRSHEALGVDVSSRWVDQERFGDLMANLERLAEAGHLREEAVPVWECADGCLKLEMLADTTITKDAKVYAPDEHGVPVCRFCGTTAKMVERLGLVMRFPGGLPAPKAYPAQMQSDVDELTRRTSGSRMLVSRRRDTGVRFAPTGGQAAYNVDVDFFWMTYLRGLADGRPGVSLVGSNHVRRHLVTIAALHRVLAGEAAAPVRLILPAYVLDADGDRGLVDGGYLDARDPNRLRLLAFSSIGWGRDTRWAMDFSRYIERRVTRLLGDTGRGAAGEAPSVDAVAGSYGLVRRQNVQRALDAGAQHGEGWDVRGMVVPGDYLM